MSDVASVMTMSMLIGDEVVTVTPQATLAEVAQVMADRDVGAVAVGAAGQVSGIVSERDLVRVIAGGGDPAEIEARTVATDELVWCQTTSTVAEVANEMLDHYVRHVLVADGSQLAGIVSARDLLGVYATDETTDAAP